MYTEKLPPFVDILRGSEDFVVIPVNLKGVMGKGLALQCKMQFPKVFGIYTATCGSETFRKPGDLMSVKDGGRSFILFPTKNDPRDKSKLEWIVAGLHSLRALIATYLDQKERYPLTIAIPPLGCGLGGLDKNLVENEIKTILSSLPHNVKVNLYDFNP